MLMQAKTDEIETLKITIKQIENVECIFKKINTINNGFSIQ